MSMNRRGFLVAAAGGLAIAAVVPFSLKEHGYTEVVWGDCHTQRVDSIGWFDHHLSDAEQQRLMKQGAWVFTFADSIEELESASHMHARNRAHMAATAASIYGVA